MLAPHAVGQGGESGTYSIPDATIRKVIQRGEHGELLRSSDHWQQQ